MRCRTEKLREELVKIYDIKPISHVKLLDGQSKSSCTGDLLTDNYYCFVYKRKKSDDPLKSFFCGSHGSKDFLRLLNMQPLPCFNPLRNTDETTGVGYGYNSNGSKTTKKWNETSTELHNALNLLIIYWDITPSGAILDIILKLERFCYKEPFDSTLKAVNTIISKDKDGKTMSEIINSFDDIREFKFSNINRRLSEMNIKSYFV